MMKNTPDWMIRAAKTFVQAFLGVLIPTLVAVLNGVVDFADWGEVWAVLFPALAAALAAGISAVWNLTLERLQK